MTRTAPATTQSFASRRRSCASNATDRDLRTGRAPPQSRRIPITNREPRGADAWIATCRRSRPKEFRARTCTRTPSGLSHPPRQISTESQTRAPHVTPTSRPRGLPQFCKAGRSVRPGGFNRQEAGKVARRVQLCRFHFHTGCRGHPCRPPRRRFFSRRLGHPSNDGPMKLRGGIACAAAERSPSMGAN